MKKLNIALLTGGDSSEREVALASAHLVYEAFDRSKYNVFMVDVQGPHWTCEGAGGRRVEVDKTDFSVPAGDGKIALDYAFVMIHGTPGEDGKLQGYLEMAGIPFSTSGMVSSVITFNKSLCKEAVRGIPGISLAKGITLHAADEVDSQEVVSALGLPLFVKPNASGSSCGVTKVKSAEEIGPALKKAFAESDEVLIEEFISGREFGCGVMITSRETTAFPVTEIKPHKEFFDYEAKYTAGMSEEVTPAEIPDTTAQSLQRLAADAAKACNCRGIVRVDFIMTPDGEIYMIEINTVPGMSSGSIVPKQIAAAGLRLGDIIDTIIEDTLCRRC